MVRIKLLKLINPLRGKVIKTTELQSFLVERILITKMRVGFGEGVGAGAGRKRARQKEKYPLPWQLNSVTLERRPSQPLTSTVFIFKLLSASFIEI